MSIWSRLGKTQVARVEPTLTSKVERKASETGPAIAMYKVGQPVWSPRDYTAFADEGYIKNAITFRCITIIAQAVASIPLISVNLKTSKEIENEQLNKLLQNPSPNLTGSELIEAFVTYELIAGNSYLEAVGPQNGPPKELWTLRPDRMKVIPGATGLPAGYQYEVNGLKINWQVDRVSGKIFRQSGLAGKGTILHWKRFHPTDDWYGLSSVEPAAYAIDRHNEASNHNKSVLQNGATPSGALVFKPIKVGDNDVTAGPELIAAAEAALNARHAGSNNAGKPFVLGGNVEWETFGMNMEQLQFKDSKLDAAQDICIAYGVPIEMLLPGQSTYNNKREAKLGFYEETVLPLAETLIEHLNGWLVPRFDESMKLIPNMDEIEALSLRREIRQKNTLELFTGGLINRDEARIALQFEPEPDVLKAKIEPTVVTALAQNVPEIGNEPLYRYLKSVGLLPIDMTFEDFKKVVDMFAEARAAVDDLTADDEEEEETNE